MSPRRKRRSAEVRNSLRLFGLLAVLAGVNVYVFFFNRGTAPREVLKPSSTFKAADGASGKTATLKEAAADAQSQLKGQLAGSGSDGDALAAPAPTARHAVTATKAKPPTPVAPISTRSVNSKPTSVAAGGGPPKAAPGVGRRNATPTAAVQKRAGHTVRQPAKQSRAQSGKDVR